jgi:hypothetical protein
MKKCLSLLVLAAALKVSVRGALSVEINHDEHAPRIISEAVVKADYVEVVSSFGKEEYRTRVGSTERLLQLSNILGAAKYEARPLAWHGTRQQIEVYSKGRKTISIAQDGDKLRCFGGGLSGDYYVGSSICDAVLKWANQMPDPTAPSGRGSPLTLAKNK